MNRRRKTTVVAPRPSPSPLPKPANQIEPPTTSGNSFKDSIISGFGFGVGSSIAHKMADSIFSKESPIETSKSTTLNNCSELKLKLEKCITQSNIDCTTVYDDYFNSCINTSITNFHKST